MSRSPELQRSSSMDGLVSLRGLNPDAPVFMPNLYPQFTLYPIFPTPRHYYLSHLTSHFCYHNPYIQSFSWPALYTDTYFQSTGFPPQPENMPAVEATTPSVTAPSEQNNKMHRVSSVDQRAAVQKVNLGKYGTPSCRGRGGAWVRQAWSTKCGNSGNIGRRNAGNLNGYTRKADSLNTRGRSCARDEKKMSSPVLPVHCGVGKTTIMIRNIPSKYTYDIPFILYQYTYIHTRERLCLLFVESSLHIGSTFGNLAMNFWAWRFLNDVFGWLKIFFPPFTNSVQFIYEEVWMSAIFFDKLVQSSDPC